MEIPKRIIIEDGRLRMADGSSLRAYLRSHQELKGIKNGEFVSLLPRRHMQSLAEDAWLMKNRGC